MSVTRVTIQGNPPPILKRKPSTFLPGEVFEGCIVHWNGTSKAHTPYNQVWMVGTHPHTHKPVFVCYVTGQVLFDVDVEYVLEERRVAEVEISLKEA